MFQITKRQVDQFVPGRPMPCCQLLIELTKWPVQLEHRVELLGAKEPNNFFVIQMPPRRGCVESLLHIVMHKGFSTCTYVNTVVFKANFHIQKSYYG